MQYSDQPAKYTIRFAESASSSYRRVVPTASQIGVQDGAASYTDGFPPLNFQPVGSGGVPPFGQDMNGVLRAVTGHVRWLTAGMALAYRFDATWAAATGGYANGAIVASTTVGKYWRSLIDDNDTDPDSDPSDWASLIPDGATAATTQEIQAGTSNVVYVSPLGLASVKGTNNGLASLNGSGQVPAGQLPDATTTTSGIVELATSAETIAGTDATRGVTPAGLAATLGGGNPTAQNGYARIGPLYIQWGRFTAAANGTTAAVFPIAFPNACHAVTVSGVVAGGTDSKDNPPAVIVSTIGTSGFSVFSADDSADPVCFIAIGY